MKLIQEPVSITVDKDNSLYPVLLKFIGQTFTVEDTQEAGEDKFQFSMGSISEIQDKPQDKSLKEELLDELAKRTDANIVVREGDEDEYFEIEVNPYLVIKEFNKLFIEESVIKSILLSHITKVLGTDADSLVPYNASKKYSNSPYMTICAAVLGKGPMYLTVREDIHNARKT